MTELTATLYKYPIALPEKANKYLVVIEIDGTFQVSESWWFDDLKKFQAETLYQRNVIAWAEMPVYTEGK